MGVSAFGTTFTIGSTAVAELTNISGPGMSRNTIDVTSHDSTNGYMEFVSGLRDGGSFSIEGNFTNEAGQAALVINFNSDNAEPCVITFPTNPATTWTFDGLVTDFGNSAPQDGKLGFTATIKVSGEPVLA